jgi:hypothetical protein
VFNDGMSAIDVAGVVGVVLTLVAYAGAQAGRMDPREALSLFLNLAGSGLILGSLAFRFNLAAVLMEGAWALVALWGLTRLVLRRRSLRATQAGRSSGTPQPPPHRPSA